VSSEAPWYGCLCPATLWASVEEEIVKTSLLHFFLFIRTLSREKREVLEEDQDFSIFMPRSPEEERPEISQHFISTHM